MQGQDDDSEKTHEPTPKKILDARKKGDIAKSQDLNTTAAYVGLLIGLSLAAPTAILEGAAGLTTFIEQSDQLTVVFFDGSASGPFIQAVTSLLPFFAYIFLFPMLAVVISVLAQRSVVFAPSKISPKLSKISVLSNAKQKFGIAGLFEFAKSFLKLVTFSVCLALFIRSELSELIVTSRLESQSILIYLCQLFAQFLLIVVVISVIIGSVDYVFQVFEHNRKLMMSRKEIMDENKESEGDPHFKGQRRQRGREIALSQTLSNVEMADVVITNPTHYAVALHWTREPGSAPKCVAKGTDEIARAIRERAMEFGVPIHEDPPTARALHATTPVDGEIPQEMYKAVATAVRFAEAMRRKMRERVY